MSNDEYWSLVEPIWLQLNESWDSGPQEFARRFASIHSDERYLYAAHWCVSEVENGGLLQFFWNTTGILAPEAEDGFELIGLRALAQVLREAMGHFGETYPRDRSARVALLPEWQRGNRDGWDPFRRLDARFYDCSKQWKETADAFAVRIKQAQDG